MPSIGIKLGYSLKKCVALVKSEGIINNLKSLKIQCDDFKELLAYSWNDEINRAARTTLDKRKWNKPKLLPLTADIQKLVGHFKETIASSIIALGNNCSDVKAYRDLSSAILCSIILFNRRRSGEPARMKINAYKAVIDKKTVLNDEVSESLTEFERQLCDSFKRIEIRGKKNKMVAILLTREMERAIDLLIKLRHEVKINPDNPYLFPVSSNGSVKNIRGSDAIRKHVKLCNLKCPESITSTNLRKHVATLSQILNLEKNELEMLARFLGHDLEIHKQYYRLPENALQLAKCGKLMLLMEKGGIGKYHGKSLDEVYIYLNGGVCL